jgi:hypothetical protein
MSSIISAAALLLGLSLSPAVLQADTTPIFTAPLGALEASKSKRFAINPELGRAWVEVDVWYHNSETTESHRVSVPGLSYRAETAEVVYQDGGTSVVCARVRDRGAWIFRHQRIEPTGDCALTRQYVTAPVDDGFTVQPVQQFEVHFKPLLPAAQSSSSGDAQG